MWVSPQAKKSCSVYVSISELSRAYWFMFTIDPCLTQNPCGRLLLGLLQNVELVMTHISIIALEGVNEAALEWEQAAQSNCCITDINRAAWIRESTKKIPESCNHGFKKQALNKQLFSLFMYVSVLFFPHLGLHVLLWDA